MAPPTTGPPTTVLPTTGPGSAPSRRPGPRPISELGQFGVGRSDPLPLSAEVDEHGDLVLDTDHDAKSVPIVRYLIVHGITLDGPDHRSGVERASGQVAPCRGAGWFHHLLVCATWHDLRASSYTGGARCTSCASASAAAKARRRAPPAAAPAARPRGSPAHGSLPRVPGPPPRPPVFPAARP